MPRPTRESSPLQAGQTRTSTALSWTALLWAFAYAGCSDDSAARGPGTGVGTGTGAAGGFAGQPPPGSATGGVAAGGAATGGVATGGGTPGGTPMDPMFPAGAGGDTAGSSSGIAGIGAGIGGSAAAGTSAAGGGSGAMSGGAGSGFGGMGMAGSGGFGMAGSGGTGTGAAGTGLAGITGGGGVTGGTPGGCRPDGLYTTPGTTPNYCSVYDGQGRERLPNGLSRRIIGYFTSWRTGSNNQPRYLASDIPWDKLTHINYAFAHVHDDWSISVNANAPGNEATQRTWPEPQNQVDPALGYQGHFGLLSTYKARHPGVRTLISVGGWAKSGGYFDPATGIRVDRGGFYRLTTGPNGQVQIAQINAFADSCVAFIRQYGFDGVDIDYEYPTSMPDSGHPLDFAQANPLRAHLMKSYVVLMKTLREKLDQAGTQDNRHYLLTIAAPSSGYLNRGMETFQVTQYLDYVNIMSYDLHGAWNRHVGPNAALFDDGNDSELKQWSVYSTPQYGGIGYLNTDWAYHYFRGSLPPGRINIGVPYYTRGWRDVVVKSDPTGLWGEAQLANQSACPPGTGIGMNPCGAGALGIDNLWHDKDAAGQEEAAGSNPMWHALNLMEGKAGSYLGAYGLSAADLMGTYQRNYNPTLVASWLWNASKRVFLSTEDHDTIRIKAEYVRDRGIGGIMMWELAGDYDRQPSGEFYIGSSMTRRLHEVFRASPPYDNLRWPANRPRPQQALDVRIEVGGFKVGEQNYPLNPKLMINNQSGKELPGGTLIEFDVGTSAPDQISDQSGAGLKVVQSGHSGPNVGGLKGDFHHVQITLPMWDRIAPGATKEIVLNYQLPITTPSNFSLTLGGTAYVLKSEYPEAPLAP